MNRLSAYARANGWPNLFAATVRGLFWRMRDGFTARRLRAPGFRTGRAPRLLGISHMEIGPDFHAKDFLWLEAVVSYSERGGNEPFAPRLKIGASTRLSDHVHIGCLHRITIGDHLLCGSRVLITDHAHGAYSGGTASDPAIPPAQRPLVSSAPVVIGDRVWLGEGVAVLAGAEIGDGCVIGANSVVSGPIPPRSIAVGAPARVIRQWDEAVRDWLPVERS